MLKKKLFMGISGMVILLLFAAAGYYVWYRFAETDNIISYVPDDTVLYVHYNADAKQIAHILAGAFPQKEKYIQEDTESALIITSNGNIFMTHFKNGELVKDAYFESGTGKFKNTFFHKGILENNPNHFNGYAIIKQQALSLGEASNLFPENLTPDTKHIQNIIMTMEENMDNTVYFSVQNDFTWGITPLVKRKAKSTDFGWVPENPAQLIENQPLAAWVQYRSIFADNSNIINLIESKYRDLATPYRIAVGNEQQNYWAVEWNEHKKESIENLIQDLAHQSFPITVSGDTLPDGTLTKEYSEQKNEFPGLEKELNGISYTLYKKDTWEIALIHYEGSLILTNNEQLVEYIGESRTKKGLHCSNGNQKTFLQAHRTDNNILNMLVTQDSSSFEGIEGCLWISGK